MQNRASHFIEPPDGLTVAQLSTLVRNWIMDGDLSNRSPKTLKARRDITGKLQWFLDRKNLDSCGVDELRGFFLYLQRGHLDPGGRWGNPRETNPLRPLSLKTYHAYLRSFFSFCLKEGRIDASPMERIPAIRDPGDEVQPFSDDEVEALLRAAEKTRQSARDASIILVAMDTGARASEICNLRYSDLDFDQRSLRIREGKGKKSRTIYLGKRATRALWKYVQQDGRDGDDPLFFSERGDHLTYSGLILLFRRLGKAAGVKNCHCHRARHYYAVSYLRAGGNQMALMRSMGHRSVAMTNRYVQMADSDLRAAQQQFSPADRLGGRGR